MSGERQHTRVTRSELRRQARRKKRNRALFMLGVFVGIICAVAFVGSKFSYNKGSKIDNEYLTADDLRGDTMHILVCGIDWEEDRSTANTDVIMYVTLDMKNNSVTAFQIPRDTYIGEDVNTGGSGKINSVYGKGGNDNPMMDLVEVLNKKLGLPVDHYASLDMEAFIKMVDGIDGGLDMYVPCPIVLKDKATGNEQTIIPQAGWYKVSGETAEQIVRNRNYGTRDLQRLEVQRYFYAAVIKYFMENTDINDFIKIMSRFTEYLTTDMDWREIASIAKFGLGVSYENMHLVKPQLHGYDVIKTGHTNYSNVLVPVESNWVALINQYCLIHEEDTSEAAAGLPTRPPAGEIVRDHGVTEESITTIGDLLASAN